MPNTRSCPPIQNKSASRVVLCQHYSKFDQTYIEIKQQYLQYQISIIRYIIRYVLITLLFGVIQYYCFL